ncbi:MAG: VCBS repeat-containing protein [Ardenticatenaceae bacterium]|nr:VCBS repeat-containing protein [Ardenticatenaceae bacterium]
MKQQTAPKSFLASFASLILAFIAISLTLWLLIPPAAVQGQADSGQKDEKPNQPPPDLPQILIPKPPAATSSLLPPPPVGLTETPYWLGIDVDDSYDAAWGDVDGDGDLDLAIANDAYGGNGASKLYKNEGGILQDNPIWESSDTEEWGTSVAWGDVNGDGALDLAIGDYFSYNKVYLNDRGSLQTTPIWQADAATPTTSVAWGDVNGDGALDLVVGNEGAPDLIYLNTGTGLDTTPAWTSGNSDNTKSVALADVNGDDRLDLAVGHDNQANILYLNDGTGDFYNGAVACLGLWEWGPPTSGPEKAHSGSYVWGTNLSGNYGPSEDEYLTTPPIDLTSVPPGIVAVSWWHWIETEANFDFASVEVSNNGGTSWQVVYVVSGTVSGPTNAYLNETVLLGPGFAVNDFQMRFRLQSDNVFQFAGFYVDDLSISVGGSEVYSANFETTGGGYSAPPAGVRCLGAATDNTESIAFGDADGDGDPDLAVGNWNQPNKIYANNVDGTQWALVWQSAETDLTADVSWGDVDGDGDLDLAAADFLVGNKVYLNEEGVFGDTAVWQSDDEDQNRSVAWGDMNGDGTLDLAVANSIGPNKVYLNNATLLQTTAADGWLSANTSSSWAAAWGDMNGDGLLDLAIGNDGFNQVYLNISGTLDIDPIWTSNESDWTVSVAWGDVNGDGLLDLAVGNIGPNRVYLNNNGLLEPTASWVSSEPNSSYTVAWGDINGDGLLDLAAGNYNTQNHIYQNSGGSLPTSATWVSSESAGTVGLAFGDIDGDGDLDMAAGNWFEPNQYYLNNGDGLQDTASWESADADRTWSVAWADVNGDGRLDLAAGNDGGPNRVYLNQGSTLNPVAGWQSGDTDVTVSIAWGDVNGDGWPDLAAGNVGDPNRVYLNRQGVLQTAADNPWVSADNDSTFAIAWGDMNRDGHLDLAAANDGETNKVYLGFRPAHPFYGGQAVAIAFDYTLTPADLFALAAIQSNGTVPISYTLFHPASEPIREVRATYSLDGGQSWQPAVAAAGTITNNLASSPYPTAPTFCSNPNWAIPDSDPSGLVVTMPVSFPGNVSDLQVSMEADHTWVGDLSFILEHVDTGTAVTIFDRPGVPNTTFGCSSNNIDAILDDEALLPVEDECRLLPPAIQGTFTPNNPLSAFDGESFNGTWQLTAVDHASPDTGTLIEWCLLSDSFAPAAPLGTSTNTHTFLWDVFGSGFFGQSDNVMFRLEALPDLSTQANHVPGPFQRPIIAAQTYPFRVRGTQIQVISNTLPAANAIVYRVPAGQVADGDPIANNGGIPFRTNAQGLLQGRGSLTSGDSLVALLPQTGIATNTTCSTPNLAIPDNDPNGLSDNLVINSSGAIQDLNVSISTTHTWVGDLTFTLEHAESGSSITLINRPGDQTNPPYGCSGDNINVTLDDDADAPVENQCDSNPPAIHGNFQPDEALSTFNGEDVSGTWTLTVSDQASPDTGTLVEWCLISESKEESYTLYHTSAAPTETGLDMYTFNGGGLQTLTVAPDNPLLLFDLDISLEWDARNDGLFLADLQDAVREASTVLYDVSNGQIAIGEVRLHQNRANWLTSDVVVYASSNIRPRAAMGGIVLTGTNDINANGVITNAYLPGQVTMGPIWDPFGENQFDLGQEWWRALAHELAHYLLFLPDNYVGVSDNGGLIGIDCQGSFMTNTSDDSYSEFLTAAGWTGICLQSIAERVTGRYDWETITQFYPMLSGAGGNIGPSVLPINVTKVTANSPVGVATAVPVRNFDLRNAQTNALISLPQAQGYILRENGTPSDISDDSIVDLGATRGGGDRIKVRGATPGDRVCVSGLYQGDLWQGCEAVTENSASILVAPITGWNPNIIVTPVNTRTIRITVTQAAASGLLNAQLIPAYGSQADQTVVNSPWSAMTALGNDRYATVLTVDYPTFQGTVRVWEPGTAHESISRYVLDTTTWGGSLRGWNGGSLRGWNGGSLRGWNGAPSVSGDGQLTVFNVNDPYGETGVSALQSLSVVPALPSWLTLVGQGYVVVETAAYTDNTPRTLAYDYLQRDVPDGYEYALNIYFLAEGSSQWQRLITTVDDDENRAIADMPLDGGGIYVLVTTIEMPGLEQGWNLLAYPVPATRTVGLALASIEEDYTTIVEPDGQGSWLVHDQTVQRDHPEFAAYVNTLSHLTFGHSYWIYAITDTIPFIGVPDGARPEANAVDLPPGTFYGWISPSGDVTVAAGDVVTAVIDGHVCGTGTVTDTVGSQLAYKLFVKADAGDGCGTNGRVISFVVNGYVFPDLFSRSADIGWNSQAWFHPLGLGQRAYLPFIGKNVQHVAPDLVVESITIQNEDVEVVIGNQGSKPVPAEAAYWVDLYVNPANVPQLNQSWQNISSAGIVWGVTGITLEPGQTLTLSLNDSYYVPEYSSYAGPPAPGSAIYVQVDSANPNTTYGAVLETHEINGETYNNVMGIIYIPE